MWRVLSAAGCGEVGFATHGGCSLEGVFVNPCSFTGSVTSDCFIGSACVKLFGILLFKESCSEQKQYHVTYIAGYQ